VADTDFVPLPGGSAGALLNPSHLRERAMLIGERSMGRANAGVPPVTAVALVDVADARL
jgi:gamma-glutamyltranspeptidase/glutathione hydrolase